MLYQTAKETSNTRPSRAAMKLESMFSEDAIDAEDVTGDSEPNHVHKSVTFQEVLNERGFVSKKEKPSSRPKPARKLSMKRLIDKALGEKNPSSSKKITESRVLKGPINKLFGMKAKNPQRINLKKSKNKFSEGDGKVHVNSSKRKHVTSAYGTLLTWWSWLNEATCMFCFREGVERTEEENDISDVAESRRFKTEEERLLEEWRRTSESKDSVVSVKQIKAMLKRLNVFLPTADVVSWVEKYDSDKSGNLNFEKFKQMFYSLQSRPDLREEFLRAKLKESDDSKIIEKMGITVSPKWQLAKYEYLLPDNLLWFFQWAANGESNLTLDDCVELIKKYSPNKIPESISDSRARSATEESQGDSFTRGFSFLSARPPFRRLFPKVQEEVVEQQSKGVHREGSDVSLEFSNIQMSYESFVKMLTDLAKNKATDPVKIETVYQDMTRPLSEYFISSSHNSYLKGNQINSESSADAIVRILRLGVRVIEIDAWDGPNGIPIVTHGHTLCKPTSFENCIDAINRLAFLRSEYPLIVTIENHCSRSQQKIEVEVMTRIFGEKLFTWNMKYNSKMKIDELKLEAEVKDESDFKESELWDLGPIIWMSPEQLKNKIIIRDRPVKKLKKKELGELKIMEKKQVQMKTKELTSSSLPRELMLSSSEKRQTMLRKGSNYVNKAASSAIKTVGSMRSSVARDSSKMESRGSVGSIEKRSSSTEAKPTEAGDNFSISTSAEPQSSLGSSSLPDEEETISVAQDTAQLSLKSRSHRNSMEGILEMSMGNDVPDSKSKSGVHKALLRLIYMNNVTLEFEEVEVEKKGEGSPSSTVSEAAAEDCPATGERPPLPSSKKPRRTFSVRDTAKGLSKVYRKGSEDIRSNMTSQVYLASGQMNMLANTINSKDLKRSASKDGSSIAKQVVIREPGFASSSSIKESTLTKIISGPSGASAMNSYTKHHIVRVYPAASRITSSNYNPIPAWNAGCQIVALNYQNHKLKVWLNQGKFRVNGGCGFILKPKEMRFAAQTGVDVNADLAAKRAKLKEVLNLTDEEEDTKFPVWDPIPSNFRPKTLFVRVISGHYLPKAVHGVDKERRELINPFVHLSFKGIVSQDHKTTWVKGNGFNPRWNETFQFQVHCDELSLIAFVVKSREKNNEGSFVAQQVVPIEGLRPGFRVVNLKTKTCVKIDGAHLMCRFWWG